MVLLMKLIKFKSTPSFWRKEYLGLKPNTVRQFDEVDDPRIVLLVNWQMEDSNELTIEIENIKTKEVFKRRVTDVSHYNTHWIISWEHKLT